MQNICVDAIDVGIVPRKLHSQASSIACMHGHLALDARRPLFRIAKLNGIRCDNTFSRERSHMKRFELHVYGLATVIGLLIFVEIEVASLLKPNGRLATASGRGEKIRRPRDVGSPNL